MISIWNNADAIKHTSIIRIQVFHKVYFSQGKVFYKMVKNLSSTYFLWTYFL